MAIREADKMTGRLIHRYSSISFITNYLMWHCTTCGGYFPYPENNTPYRCPYCGELR